GGAGGGQVVAVGTPEQIAENKNSLTGKYLKKYLENVVAPKAEKKAGKSQVEISGNPCKIKVNKKGVDKCRGSAKRKK
ncbi:MAG: hypothetical protein LBF28_02725, partial [Rickettsiales bacterium]|nr:hypothetical protein [Rickettsiales bacterium]